MPYVVPLEHDCSPSTSILYAESRERVGKYTHRLGGPRGLRPVRKVHGTWLSEHFRQLGASWASKRHWTLRSLHKSQALREILLPLLVDIGPNTDHICGQEKIQRCIRLLLEGNCHWSHQLGLMWIAVIEVPQLRVGPG